MTEVRELLEKIAVQLSVFDLKQSYALIGEIQELLAQPEQEPTTRHALDSYWNQEAYQRGYAQAERDSKREPLSDENICEILLNKEWKGFVELVRIIEKAHGITGGGECVAT